MNDWYNAAADSLKKELAKDDVNQVNGFDYLYAYIKTNQPDIFSDIDFTSDEELDDVIRSNIEQFEEWLKSEAKEWLYVGKRYLWIDRENYTEPVKKDLAIESPVLLQEEINIVEKDICSFKEDDYDILNNAYQKSLNLDNKEFTATCAHLIAQYHSKLNILPYYDRANYWDAAGDAAIKANKPGSFRFFRKAAEIYASAMVHHDSAKSYKKSLDQAVVEKTSKDTILEIARVCRKQYEMSGEADESAKIFIQENNIKLKHAEKRREKVFHTILKYLFNYGESPLYLVCISSDLI